MIFKSNLPGIFKQIHRMQDSGLVLEPFRFRFAKNLKNMHLAIIFK